MSWFFKKKIRNYLFTPILNLRNKNSLHLFNPIIFQCIELISNSAINIKVDNFLGDWASFINQAIINFEVNGNLFISKIDNKLEVLDTEVGLKKMKSDEVLHIKKMVNNNGVGISPIDTLNKHINTYESMLEYITAISQNGGRLSGILSLDSIISDKDKQNVSNEFNQLKNNCTILLEGNYKWETIGLSPKDLNILEMSKYIETIMVTTMGVPSILLGKQDATFASYKEALLHFREEKVKPIVILIISHCNSFFNLNVEIKN